MFKKVFECIHFMYFIYLRNIFFLVFKLANAEIQCRIFPIEYFSTKSPIKIYFNVITIISD